MAHEGHAAVLAHVVGCGLADVVEESAEAERLPARELVRERFVQHLAQLTAGLALELDQPLQHLDRVAIDVEVVVVALVHVVQVGELGQDGAHQAEPVREREPLQRCRRHEEPAQLREHALSRGLAHPRRRVRGEPLRLGIGREAQLGGEARQAQRAQRVVLVGPRTEHPQRARLEVGAAAEWVDQIATPPSAAPSRSRVKSRFARSSSIVSPWSRAKS